MVNDTISDLLTRIRNAGLNKDKTVSVIHTKMNYKISQILKKEGFIQDFHIIPDDDELLNPKSSQTISLTLKYFGRFKKPCITNLKRLSSSSLRIYSNYKDIPSLLNGMGVIIVSTSKGVMTDRDARSKKIGGELIWSIL